MLAAELAGASAATRFGQPPSPVHARLETRILRTRPRGGEAAWDAAYAAGSALPLHDAIDRGLAAIRKPYNTNVATAPAGRS